jgi:hypothetical protein
VARLADIFPASEHVRDVGLAAGDDHAVWEYAKVGEFAIVSKDADFRQLSFLYGSPPLFIWGDGNRLFTTRPWRSSNGAGATCGWCRRKRADALRCSNALLRYGGTSRHSSRTWPRGCGSRLDIRPKRRSAFGATAVARAGHAAIAGSGADHQRQPWRARAARIAEPYRAARCAGRQALARRRTDLERVTSRKDRRTTTHVTAGSVDRRGSAREGGRGEINATNLTGRAAPHARGGPVICAIRNVAAVAHATAATKDAAGASPSEESPRRPPSSLPALSSLPVS